MRNWSALCVTLHYVAARYNFPYSEAALDAAAGTSGKIRNFYPGAVCLMVIVS